MDKIDEDNTNQHVVSYFIRSGETLNVQMPLGSYTIKYATGQNGMVQNIYLGRIQLIQKQMMYLILSQMDMKLMAIL